jgi:glycosyltransferase involved in cell wall biosynthesis
MLFSIVTPTYNCREKIAHTVQSVLSQSDKDLEYLIIDGSSTDGTEEWLSGLKDPRVRMLSEHDLGIYDAMNKGVKMAKGHYILFLGAGDTLYPDVLKKVRTSLHGSFPEFIYGDVFWADRLYDGPFSKEKLALQNICHQAIFYHQKTFDLVGCFNLKFKLLADWEMNMRCFGDDRIKIAYVPIAVSIYEDGGASDNKDILFEKNRGRLIKKHLGWNVFLRTKLTLMMRKVSVLKWHYRGIAVKLVKKHILKVV